MLKTVFFLFHHTAHYHCTVHKNKKVDYKKLEEIREKLFREINEKLDEILYLLKRLDE